MRLSLRAMRVNSTKKPACLTPQRHEAHSRRNLVLHAVSPRHFPMRQVKNSPMKRSIQRCMTVLKFVKPNQASRFCVNLDFFLYIQIFDSRLHAPAGYSTVHMHSSMIKKNLCACAVIMHIACARGAVTSLGDE